MEKFVDSAPAYELNSKDLTPGVLLGSLFGSVTQGVLAKKSFSKRLAHLKYYKVRIPFGLFAKFPSAREAYQEGIYAYFFGLHSLSRLAMINTLKLALRKKRGEGKYFSGKIGDLVNWSARQRGSEHQSAVAKGLLVRNVGEENNLDIIRYFSEIINSFYPYKTGDISVFCPSCGKLESYEIPVEDLFLGNSVSVKCRSCTNSFSLFLVG